MLSPPPLPFHQHIPDLALEADDVAPHDLLRPLTVAREHGPQQLDVLVHSLAEPHLAVDHQVPEPQAEVEVALEGGLEERVVRGPIDLAVDLLVEPHQLTLVTHALALKDIDTVFDCVG